MDRRQEFKMRLMKSIIDKNFSEFIETDSDINMEEITIYKRDIRFNLKFKGQNSTFYKIHFYMDKEEQKKIFPNKLGLWIDDLFFKNQDKISISKDYSYDYYSTKDWYFNMDKDRYFQILKNTHSEKSREIEDNEEFFNQNNSV